MQDSWNWSPPNKALRLAQNVYPASSSTLTAMMVFPAVYLLRAGDSGNRLAVV